MMGNARAPSDSWLSMLYFGMNLPGSFAGAFGPDHRAWWRAARREGPGGMAVGAMAASAGVSAAASGLSSAASDGDPIGRRRRRRRSAQEQRGVTRPRQRNHTGAQERAPANTTTEAQRCAANGESPSRDETER